MATASPNGGTTPDKRPQDPRLALSQTINIPPDVLARHGARILDPSTAARDWNGRRPRSTVYRADTLLIPARDAETIMPDNDYNTILRPLGVRLSPPDIGGWRERLRPLPAGLSIPVALTAREDVPPAGAPDPWTALVALRRKFPRDARATGIALDHLLYSAVVEGAPFSGGGSVGDSQGQASGIALYTGSRNPVQFLGAAPDRGCVADLGLGRRPVVAVLDTGIGLHNWLPVGDRGSVGYDPYVPVWDMSSDPVVEVSLAFQQALEAHELATAAASGTEVVDSLGAPMEVRDWVDPLLGLTDSHAGHGTFVTGLIHQVCPQARVLSLRVLHSDGFSTEGSLLFALEWLRQRVEGARANGRPDELVDVVSLSLGFYSESATPDQQAQVATAIQRLTDLGVMVVAAAGNDATTRPFMPAACGLTNPMLAAIGARNASGITTAAFSNYGEWISRWAPGNAMVSTVPVWQGPKEGTLRYPDALGLGPRWRTSPDDDDLTTGFAVWAGTSFATPVISGMVAAELVAGAAHGVDTAEQRAAEVLRQVDEKLVRRGWIDPAPATATATATAVAVPAAGLPG